MAWDQSPKMKQKPKRLSRSKAVVPLSRAEVPLEEEFEAAKCQAEVPARVPLGYRFAAGFERYLTGTRPELPLEDSKKTTKCQAEVPAQVPLEYRFAGFERYLTVLTGTTA